MKYAVVAWLAMAGAVGGYHMWALCMWAIWWVLSRTNGRK